MLDMKIPVLDKADRWPEHILNLTEEFTELVQSFLEGNIEHTVEETFDVIQICVGILDKFDMSDPWLVKSGYLKHIEKLHSRGWNFKKWLDINED